jgi:hypothetical protein
VYFQLAKTNGMEDKGLPQDPGTYVWFLDYINSESGKRVVERELVS